MDAKREAALRARLERMAGRSYEGLPLEEAFGRFEMQFWGRHRLPLSAPSVPSAPLVVLAPRPPPMPDELDARALVRLVARLARQGVLTIVARLPPRAGPDRGGSGI